MAYITPSVLVYQQLEEAGGVLNTTPDLEAIIVGPLYNNVYVDPSDGSTLTRSQAATISDWDSEQAAILLDNPAATGFTIELPNTYPGQETVASSVTVHVTNSFVEINSFEIDLSFAGTDRSLITATPIAATTVAFSTALPDVTGNHANVGDKVVIEYNDGAPQVIETFITAVNSDTQVRLADQLPELALVTATAKVYKLYTYKQVASSQFTTTNIGNEEVNLLFTATPFVGSPAHPAGYPNYGFLSATVHVGYSALRQDTTSTVLTIDNQNSRESLLGEADENNPLSLAVDIALRNTVSSVKALAVASNDSTGYSAALDILQGEERAYYLVPLTQSEAIIAQFRTHVEQMSTPVEGLWRTVIANTSLPEVTYLLGNEDLQEDGTLQVVGNTVSLKGIGTSFLGLGVTPGDIVTVVVSDDVDAVGTFVVEDVVDNTTIEFSGSISNITDGATAEYYISRNLTRRQSAEIIAARSETYSSNRVWHIWPDVVGVDVNGVTTYLPGYYLCAAHAGACAGFPVQQGLTNIALAGISDLRNSNFYFTRADLGIMAEKGTCIYAQATQGGAPFCRHALTTDVSVLEYREQLKVKNWDFLSYYYRDKLKPFIGTWNITPDTLSTMRQVAIASSELLISQRLPRIGAPLLSYEIRRIEQDPNNRDQVIVEIKIEIVSPNNYTNVFLVI